MKICTRCKEEKSLDHFVKNKNQKDGYHYICKECHKIYREENKESMYSKHKEWLDNSREYISEYNKKYNETHGDEKRYLTDRWHKANPNYSNEWKRNKTVTDINYRLRSNLRSRFYNAVFKQFKIKSAIDLLGCSVKEFKEYLESMFKPEMNWENHGKIWEVDHIIGCCNFDLTIYEQQKECFHFSNHQPLFKTTAIAESFGYTNEIGNRNKEKQN